MGNKLQKAYLRNCNLLIVQDLWQAHYQILLIILLKEFIKLNVNMDMIIKSVNCVELNTKTVGAVLSMKTLNLFNKEEIC